MKPIRQIATAFALSAVLIFSLVTFGCNGPDRKTVVALHAGSQVVLQEIDANASLPDELLAEKIIDASQYAVAVKIMKDSRDGAAVLEAGLKAALDSGKFSIKSLAPIVAGMIANMRALDSLVKNEKVQRFLSLVEIGLRVLGSYFALQISAARHLGLSDRAICKAAAIDHAQLDLVTAYDGLRFEEYAAAL